MQRRERVDKEIRKTFRRIRKANKALEKRFNRNLEREEAALLRKDIRHDKKDDARERQLKRRVKS